MKRIKLFLLTILILSTVFCLGCGRKTPPVLSGHANAAGILTYHNVRSDASLIS